MQFVNELLFCLVTDSHPRGDAFLRSVQNSLFRLGTASRSLRVPLEAPLAVRLRTAFFCLFQTFQTLRGKNNDFGNGKINAKRNDAIGFDDLAEMLCDPEVMYAYERDFSKKTSGNGLTISCRATKRFRHVERDSQTKRKYDRSGGITMQPYKDGELHEIGYLFKKAFWHNGYATEAARALKKNYAFQTFET